MDNEEIKQLVEKFDYSINNRYQSIITRAATNYIRHVKSYGWNDKEFINGYQYTKWVRVTVKLNNRIQSIWNFKTCKEPYGKIGYIVNSWKDQFDLQVSKESGNIAYLMIMQKAKEINGSEIIVENLI